MRIETLRTILIAGLFAGTLDGCAASIQYFLATGGNPVPVFTYIASGVFGQAAYSGGPFMAVWGVLFHYAIATSWASLYVLLYPRIPLLSRNMFISAAFYGLFVWSMMNLVIVPLSRVRPLHPTYVKNLIGICILVVCIGLPIALITDRRRERLKSSSSEDKE